jgi:hypothetical protein
VVLKIFLKALKQWIYFPPGGKVLMVSKWIKDLVFWMLQPTSIVWIHFCTDIHKWFLNVGTHWLGYLAWTIQLTCLYWNQSPERKWGPEFKSQNCGPTVLILSANKAEVLGSWHSHKVISSVFFFLVFSCLFPAPGMPGNFF